MCAGQALAACVALIGAGAGLAFLDPLAAFLIATIAAKEGALWRGENDCCSADCCVPVAAVSPERGPS